MSYLRNVLIAVDQLGNALLAGAPDETISSRLSREDVIPVLGPALRLALNRIDPGHTDSSREYDPSGLPDPHHLPSLAREALAQVMRAGDAYLSLPELKNQMAEQEARLQRLREDALDHGRDPNCGLCGRRL